MEDFLDPNILDTFALKTNEVLEVVACSANSRTQSNTAALELSSRQSVSLLFL